MPQRPRCSGTQPENRGNPPTPASHIPSTAALLVSGQQKPLAGLFSPTHSCHPSNTRPLIYLAAMRSQGWPAVKESTPFFLFYNSCWGISFDAFYIF